MARLPTASKIDPLESWHALQAVIHGLGEKDLEALIEKEISGKARRNMVMRCHMKLNKLRYARERKELVRRTKEPNRHRASQ
jgi:hypothetical protein